MSKHAYAVLLCFLTKLPGECISHYVQGSFAFTFVFNLWLPLTTVRISLADPVPPCCKFPVFSTQSFQLVEKGFHRRREGKKGEKKAIPPGQPLSTVRIQINKHMDDNVIASI